MKRLLSSFVFLLVAISANAQSLNDEFVLGNDAVFQSRVRTAMIAAAINVSSDGLTGGINAQRHLQARIIMNSPDSLKGLFAAAIATQPTVSGPATASGTVALTAMPGGNVDTQQALVTDAVINTAVSAVYNSFFGGQ